VVIAHSAGRSVVRGDEGVRALGAIMAAIHTHGAWTGSIGRAIDVIESAGGPERVFTMLAKDARPGESEKNGIKWLRREEKLALEICAHEHEERRAFLGEVAALGVEASQAKQVAQIVEEELA